MNTILMIFTKVAVGVFGFFAIVIAVIFGGAWLQTATSTEEVPTPAIVADKGPTLTDASAAGACMQFIRKSLHDPDSAEFGMSTEASITIKDTHALVLRDVRAKNGFGALRKTTFGCVLEARGEMIFPVAIFENGKQSKKVTQRIKQLKLM